MKLILSDDADTDFAEILQFTRRRFGRDQARRYGIGLALAMRKIAESAASGRAIEGFPSRFRKATYKAHHIFFVHEDEALVVVRVLHQAQDPSRYIAI